MSSFTLARPGIAAATSDGSFAQDNALFLKIWSGEVLTAFHNACVTMPLHRTRSIPNGKSASFSAIGTLTASYHTPGTEISGQSATFNEKIINIDDLLIASVALSNLEEAKNHFDVRGPLTTELGQALAQKYDKHMLQLMLLAARATTDYLGTSKSANAVTDANIATDADVLKNGIFKAAQLFDEQNIPETDRSIIVRPAQFFLLLQDTDVVNSLWGGRGSIATATIPQLAGLNIIKSNNIPSTNISSTETGTNNTYIGNFTTSVAVAVQKEAVGTVSLLDVMSEQEYSARYQTTLMLSKYAKGSGILRANAAVELKTS